jgi:hypothetical protein
MVYEYARGHTIRIMALNMIIFFVGLFTLATPFMHGEFPGALDTTDHVALGALICVLSIFRAVLAFGSIWIDVCLFALGVIVLSMPTIMHMRWEGHYNFSHMLHGLIIMACSFISTILTIPVLKQRPRR